MKTTLTASLLSFVILLSSAEAGRVNRPVRRGFARKTVVTALVASTVAVGSLGVFQYGRGNAARNERNLTAYHDAKGAVWGRLSLEAAQGKIAAMAQYPVGAPAAREILLAQVEKSPGYQDLAAGIPLDSEQGFQDFVGYHNSAEQVGTMFGLPLKVSVAEENTLSSVSPSVQANRERVRKLSQRIFTDIYRDLHARGKVGNDFTGEDLREAFVAPYDAKQAVRRSAR